MSDKSAENLRGMLLLTVAMAGIAGLDSLGKIASRHADSAWVITGVGLGAFVGFLILMRGQQPLFTRDALNPAALTRTLCEAGASTLMIISLAFVPLSMITVLMQTVPLMITLGAVLFLGERAAWQDWASLAAGFGGMLLIVQPGSEALGPGILITVAATIGFAMRDQLPIGRMGRGRVGHCGPDLGADLGRNATAHDPGDARVLPCDCRSGHVLALLRDGGDADWRRRHDCPFPLHAVGVRHWPWHSDL